MKEPVLMGREWPMSRFGARGLDGAARQHSDQVRAVFGAAVQVAVQAFCRHGHAIQHLVRKPLLQSLLERADAEHAASARAGDGDAHVRGTPGDEYPDQRVTRSLVAEFTI